MPVGRRNNVSTSACLSSSEPVGFARAAFKQHVVQQPHRRAAMLLEDGEDVLEKIELLVARARPEIIAVSLDLRVSVRMPGNWLGFTSARIAFRRGTFTHSAW